MTWYDQGLHRTQPWNGCQLKIRRKISLIHTGNTLFKDMSWRCFIFPSTSMPFLHQPLFSLTTDTDLHFWLSSEHECYWDYINVTTDSNSIGGLEFQDELMVFSTIPLLVLSQVFQTFGVGMQIP